MKILYIDTSSSYLYVGVVSNDTLLGEVKKDFGHELSKYTVSEIDKLFKKLNLQKDMIDKIIVVAGPGSYTGIRIGMTFAKIYAYTKNIPITMITSLEAMATSVSTKKLIVPILDARRGYVYAGVYANDTNILKEQYIKLSDLKEYLDNLKQDYLFVTNDTIFNFSNMVKYEPDILKIVLKYKNKENINPHLIEPTYLKLTEAEENLKENKNDN